MALSDYLTEDEWDACFYRMCGGAGNGNLGDAMHDTINILLEKGHNFPGLDDSGSKLKQILGTSNPYKVCIFLGNPHDVDVLEVLDNGRRWLKENYPDLVEETDDEWEREMKEVRELQSKDDK